MSVLKDYLTLLPKAFENRKDIAEALITKAKRKLNMLPEAEQKVIIGRKLICDACSFNSKNTDPEIYTSDRLDEHCIHCTCNIDLKTECLSCKCGIDVWNKSNPDNQLPLKWTEYKQPTDET